MLVIVTLISLMKDQVSDLNSRGIRASYAAFLDDWGAFSHSVKLPNKGFVLVGTVTTQNIS